MRRGLRFTSLLIWFLLAIPLPAYANAPPAPDGMFSLLMILPVAILGVRLAGAKLPPSGKAKRILLGLALGFSILISGAGPASFGFFSLGGPIFLLCYGVLRGGQAMKHGQGWKRFALSAVVMLLTLLAAADYVASLTWSYQPTALTESNALGAVRTINTAENTFRSDANLVPRFRNSFRNRLG